MTLTEAPALDQPAPSPTARAAWATASVFLLLGSLLVAIIISLEVPLTAGGEYSAVLNWIFVAMAIGQLGYRLASRTPALLDISFWCFVLVFFGVSAIPQLVEGVFPLMTTPYSDKEVLEAQIRVLLGCLAYLVGRQLVANRRPGPVRYELSAPRARKLGYFGLVIVGFTVATRGLRPFFESRWALNSALLGTAINTPIEQVANKTSGLLLQYLSQAPVFIALCVMLRPGTSRRGRIFIAALIVGNIIANNPIGSARYWFGTVVAGLIASRIRFDRRWMALGFTMVALTTSLFAYAYLDLFRVSGGPQPKTITPAQTIRTAYDFGMWQQELNASRYTDENGLLLGSQMAGAVFGFVPRSLWTSKPYDTGDLIGQAAGFNVSASLWSEFYVDFGYLGIVLGFVGVGAFFGMVDKTFMARGGEVLLAFLPPLATFDVFFLRGSLQPAIGDLLPVIAAMAFVVRRVRVDDS